MINSIKARTPLLALILFVFAIGYTFAAKVVVVPLGGDSMPSGMVSSFNKKACPAGWKKYTKAQGRFVIGLNDGGTLGSRIGGAIKNNGYADHDHVWAWFFPPEKQWRSYAPDGSTTIIVDWGDGIGDYLSGYYPLARHDSTGHGTYLTDKKPHTPPYVQLLYCEKV